MPATVMLFALLAVTSPADTEKPQPEPILHSALYFELGLGSPLGWVGIESVTRVTPWFELSGGLGLGLAAAESEPDPSLGHMLQWSCMPRLLWGNNLGGLTLGVGASGGNFGDLGIKWPCLYDSCPSTYSVGYVVWANAEVGAEVWIPFGLAGRIALGWAHGWCTSGDCSLPGLDAPYIGAGIGYAF